MARGGRGRKKKERITPDADKKKVLAFTRDIDQCEATAEQANASLKDAWKSAREGRVHVKALKAARRLLKLSPLERSEFLRCFEEYCDHLGVNAQQEMPLDMGESVNASGKPIPNTPPLRH